MNTHMPSALRRAACVFLAALLCLSFMAPTVAEAAVTQADIDALKKEASSLSSKKSELKNQLSALSEDKDEAMKKKDLLDEQCAVIQEEIDNVNAQISQYETLIAQTEQQISETEEKEQAQYELFCRRVRAMEENGTVSYWEVIFKATSFADLLSRIDFINEIMDYDERVIQDLKDLQAQLAEEKSALEESKAAQEEAKQELSSRKAELQAQLDEAIALMKTGGSAGCGQQYIRRQRIHRCSHFLDGQRRLYVAGEGQQEDQFSFWLAILPRRYWLYEPQGRGHWRCGLHYTGAGVQGGYGHCFPAQQILW